jgi:hypothetical protein
MMHNPGSGVFDRRDRRACLNVAMFTIRFNSNEKTSGMVPCFRIAASGFLSPENQSGLPTLIALFSLRLTIEQAMEMLNHNPERTRAQTAKAHREAPSKYRDRHSPGSSSSLGCNSPREKMEQTRIQAPLHENDIRKRSPHFQ